MTATKAKRHAPRPLPTRVTSQAPAPPALAPDSNPNGNGKKKKKKKSKGKGVERNSPVAYDEDEDDEDEDSALPALEPMGGLLYEHARTVNRTGLSPELASVHVSTTASLAAHLKPTAAEAELFATADHLARSMEGAEGGLVNDEYWASFPDHLRNFTQAMYAIAQQMHSGATKDGGGRYPPGAFPGMPFDPAIFADPQFALAMEQAAAANGALQTADGGLSPANVVLYPEEHEYVEDEYYSEDDDELGDERRAQAHFTLSFEDPRSPAAVTAAGQTNGYSAPKRRNKKKKGKGGEGPELQSEEAILPAGIRPEEGKGGTVTNGGRPLSASNRMPTSHQDATKVPSSRAAGKRPMSYNPAQDTLATSQRAASKAVDRNNHPHHHPSPPSSNTSAPKKPRPPATGQQQPKNSKIWSTSTTEERERIKEFWLGLGEDERRNLVKVEKDAVLKKMKEQQKHSCSCAVCGRKRNAIEEELEVLYDAYYEELEQYANYQQRYISSGGTLPPPQGPGPFPGSVELDKNGTVISPQPPNAHRGKNPAVTNGRKPVKHTESEFEDDGEDEYADDDAYEDEEEDEEDDEEEDEEDGEPEDDDDVKQDRTTAVPRPRVANSVKANGTDGLGNFGDNLTVTGNILTVADDLLKNDGQKFLEMMEQLAERRMQREEDAAVDIEEESDDDDDEGEEDEDGEEDDDDDDDDEDEEIMTEEQKMEEGKRMFSIFAARMFEQRVLQAYREKVAQERQLQLLRELEDEDKQSKEREAKKQTQNQKKKDKKRQQKVAKEEERAARAAEKAAEEAEQRAKQAALEEKMREQREKERAAKRESQRKAQEEEKARREEERRKRQAEEREREAQKRERELKAKAERKEQERKEREARLAAEKVRREQQEKEREEREKAEKEREEKEKEERERLAREKAEKDKAEREARERAAQQRKNNVRPPASPRNAVPSGSSQSSPIRPAPQKKILSKPPTPAVPPALQQPRLPPQQVQPRVPISVVGTSQPSTPITPQLPPPPQTPTTIFPTPLGVGSPRLPFAPGPFVGVNVPFGPSIQQGPPSLAPSAVPRGFGNGNPFDGGFGRGLAPPAPIAPPTRPTANILASPTQLNLAPGPSSRPAAPDPGPITRPTLAPIARPTGDASGSGSTSPSRRSPSPKGVLGSSALLADDDEVVTSPATRRAVAPGAVGQGWGPSAASPRGSVSSPWGLPGPPPAFSIRPPNTGP